MLPSISEHTAALWMVEKPPQEREPVAGVEAPCALAMLGPGALAKPAEFEAALAAQHTREYMLQSQQSSSPILQIIHNTGTTSES